MEKAIIVINEDHNLLPVQEAQLKGRFGKWATFAVPKGGLPSDKQRALAEGLWELHEDIIFVSPVPMALATAALLKGKERSGRHRVWLFVNDKREKKALPDGRVISILAFDGWRLEEI